MPMILGVVIEILGVVTIIFRVAQKIFRVAQKITGIVFLFDRRLSRFSVKPLIFLRSLEERLTS